MKTRAGFFDYDKETGWSKEINMERIDTKINIFKNIQEVGILRLLGDVQSMFDKPSDSSREEKVKKTLEDYNKNKIMYKDLIEYLENIKTKGSSSSPGFGMEGIEEEGEEEGEEEEGLFGF
jgi:signal recognition particle GTPase